MTMRNTIFLALVISGFGIITAQNKISGTVKNSKNEVLPGANVIEKGAVQGTITDMDGKFTLTTGRENPVLVVSFVGFETREVTVRKRRPITIVLREGLLLEEVVMVGSRNPRRANVNAPVPVDLIDIQKLISENGKIEIADALQYAAPSFNATRQSGADGADHIVPASLRGMGPDQTLVLINGKRRHQSSLINIFGTRGRGNTGTDLNAIPASAVKRIEILRDGASAQYGSDAIAGVINMVLKNSTDGIEGAITYGAYSTCVGGGWDVAAGERLWNINGKNRLDGKDKKFDGESVKLELNYGMPLNEKGGFVNITTELLSKKHTLRPAFSVRKGYGSASIDGFNFMVNASLPISDKTEMYAFGGRNYRDTDAFAFSRGLPYEDKRTVPSLHPNGFTPSITSNIIDGSISVGFKRTLQYGWNVDVNNTYGKNIFHYFIKNTNNASLLGISPVDFDAGGHSLSQNTTSLNVSNYFDQIMKGTNIAFGLVYRTQNFVVFAGEESSYTLYDKNRLPVDTTTPPEDIVYLLDEQGNEVLDEAGQKIARPGGSQGFLGYSKESEVNRSETNVGLYVDSEVNLTEHLLVSAALRYEEHSGFGNTFNYKVASRYKLNENLSFRGSLSSGFRAPSLAQIYYNLRFTNVSVTSDSKIIPSLLSANNSTITKAFGIQKLKEEKSLNKSIGFTYKQHHFMATVDAYEITVDDRIILTDPFDTSAFHLGVDKAHFFANGVDTRTRGIDMVFSYFTTLANNHTLKMSLVGNLNSLEIKKIHTPDLSDMGISEEKASLVFFGPLAQSYLKAAAPDYKFGLRLGYTHKKIQASLQATQFSAITLQDFQWVEMPPNTFAEAEQLKTRATDTYNPVLTTDISVGYTLLENLQCTVGGNNIFNRYPTPQFDGFTEQGGLADAVQMGIDGAYYFARVEFRF